ncbi:MAG: phenylalanine--tRNA ligase subunit alpha, partial [Oscillospiraceae bacterium]|nr:phenylalanine--tRNA ligase subunit alpha [Oscillospiraceae bacterium]
MKEQLEEIRSKAIALLDECADIGLLDDLRVKYLGKKGELTAILKQMGKLTAEERPAMGQLANKVRADIEEKIAEKSAQINEALEEARIAAETIDVTLPGKKQPVGRLHPLTKVLDEVKDVFLGMGFDIVDG